MVGFYQNYVFEGNYDNRDNVVVNVEMHYLICKYLLCIDILNQPLAVAERLL